MRNAVTGLGLVIVLLAGAIGAMLDPDRRSCHEEKGLTGDVHDTKLCGERLSALYRRTTKEQKTSPLHLRSDEAPIAPNAGPNTGVFNTAIVVPAANDPLQDSPLFHRPT